MEPLNQIVHSLFASGDFLRLLQTIGFPQASIARYDPATRAIIAQALVYTGHYDEAVALAELDAGSPSDASVRSKAELALGSVARCRGDLVRAAQHFQSAIRLATDARDSVQTGWSHLAMLRLLIDGHAHDAIAARLGEVRRAVTQAGDARVSAYLHECVAILEGQTGGINEAARHCDITESLLDAAPNDWLRVTAMMNRGCIACLCGDLDTAYNQFRLARRIAVKIGRAAMVENNLGHVERLRGHWSSATRWFESVLNKPDVHVLNRAAATDGIAKIALALGQLDECERLLLELDKSIGVDETLRRTYNLRWTSVTKARARLRRGDFARALELIEDAKQTAADVGDRPLLATLQALAAQGLSAAGRHSEASIELVAASNTGGTAYPEIHGQHYYASALIIQGRNDELERQLRQRAQRLWKEQGFVSFRLEMSDSANTDDEAEVQTPCDTACIADTLASVFDVGFSPTLLGAELVNAIRGLGCSDDLRISIKQKPWPAHIKDQVGIPLGNPRRAHAYLTCSVPSDPVKAILLADVLRVGRAAVELERYRQEERTRAALWPADPIETEAGALFLAEEMQSLLATARRVAPTTVPILITGETGTGKEVLARLIHAYSTRAKATFLPFNCSATPKDMLDSQLFGHRRGAFTGATDSFPGVIRAAAGGTLLLDEIGELTADVQPKLLRFLESNEVHPLGETHPGKVDVRIIAATNADLDALVSEGRFREDLFYRLNIVRLHLPPLRERRVEIPALANHYLRKHAREIGKGDLRLAEETMEYLVLFRWPGNVRQLANEMRRLAALAETGAVLMPEHLSADIFASRKTVPASERTLEPTELVVRLDQPMAAAVQHVERAMIVYAMQKCGGGMEDTASLLGLSRKGLYLKRQRYAIETPGEDAAAVA